MYKITNSADSADIKLYSLIEGGITASKLLKSLEGLAPDIPITLHINSDGGEIFDAIALYNSLKSRNVYVIVEGMCASAASIVAMAGKHILMRIGSLMMVHNPITAVKGDSDALKDAAALMDKITQSMADIYSERTGLDREQVIALMASEAYMTPEEAVRLHFADEIELPAQPTAPSYQDGILAERERMHDLDELMAPGRETLIARAKYETGASASDIALDLLKIEAAKPHTAINGFSAPDKFSDAMAAMTATIERKRGY